MTQRPAMAPVHYRVLPSSPDGHLFTVTMVIQSPDSGGQSLSLPAWVPGSYLVRDFARHIISISASGPGGEPVALVKRDKSSWFVSVLSGPLTVQYRIHARDLSVRSAYLDRHYGFFNGTSLFLLASGLEEEAHSVEILAPEPGSVARDWQVATTMPAVDVDDSGFGLRQADHYHALVDYPVTLGDLTWLDFEVADIPHRIALSGHFRTDCQRLIDDVSAICKRQVALFGELPVEREYIFHLHAADSYGGLEHRDSSSLLVPRHTLPPPDGPVTERERDGYNDLLGLFSHEYFHLWHVKRIRPAAFIPQNLEREVHTSQLWIFEGLTSYYDDLGVLRSGAIDRATYLKQLGRLITRVMRGSGRQLQSVAESSFDAWTRFYQQDANAANAIVSYYAKGALIALSLDLLLRLESDSSLDAVMVALWRRYGMAAPSDHDHGVPEGALEELLIDFFGQGTAMADLLQHCVHGTEEPPLADLLGRMGLKLESRPRTGSDDRGGTPPADSLPIHPGIGLTTEMKWSECRVLTVRNGSPAERAGLAPDDTIVALDGLRVGDGIDPILRRTSVGARLPLHYFRRDVLYETELVLEPAPQESWSIEEVAGTTATTSKLLEDWLGTH